MAQASGGRPEGAPSGFALAVHPADRGLWMIDSRHTVADELLGSRASTILFAAIQRYRLLAVFTTAGILGMCISSALIATPSLRATFGARGAHAVHLVSSAVVTLGGIMMLLCCNVGLLRRCAKSADVYYLAINMILWAACASYVLGGPSRPEGLTLLVAGTALALWYSLSDAQHPGVRESATPQHVVCCISVVAFLLFGHFNRAALPDKPLKTWQIGNTIVHMWTVDVALHLLTSHAFYTFMVLFERLMQPKTLQLIGARLVTTRHGAKARQATLDQLVGVKNSCDPPYLSTRRAVRRKRAQSRGGSSSGGTRSAKVQPAPPPTAPAWDEHEKRPLPAGRYMHIESRFSTVYAIDTRDTLGRMVCGARLSRVYRDLSRAVYFEVVGPLVTGFMLIAAIAHMSSEELRQATGGALAGTVLGGAACMLVIDLHTIFFLNRKLAGLCASEPYTWIVMYLTVSGFASAAWVFRADSRGVFFGVAGLHSALTAGFYDAVHPGGRMSKLALSFSIWNMVGAVAIAFAITFRIESFEQPFDLSDIVLISFANETATTATGSATNATTAAAAAAAPEHAGDLDHDGASVSFNPYTFTVLKIATVAIFLYGKTLATQLANPGQLCTIFARVYIVRRTQAEAESLLAQKIEEAERDNLDVRHARLRLLAKKDISDVLHASSSRPPDGSSQGRRGGLLVSSSSTASSSMRAESSVVSTTPTAV